MLKWSLLCFLAFFAGNAAAETIAVVGDSISTGGASHSALAFDIDKMEAVFTGKTSLGIDQATFDFLRGEGIPEPLTPPERLGLSPREFTHPLVWIFNSFVTSMSSQYLDMEEFSWAYLLGRLRNDTVLIAARDGEKSFQARQQIDRILDGAKGQPIDHVFIFFTGNDICAGHPSLITSREEYVANIDRAVRYLIKNAKPKEGGGITHVWLMDPLGVSQLVTSPVIQNKKIIAYGKEHTCKELQSDQLDKTMALDPVVADAPAAIQPTDPQMTKAVEERGGRMGLRAILAQIFQGGPYGLCPSLFNYHQTGSLDDLIPVSNALAAYREGLAELAKNLNALSPLYRVQQLNAPASLMFAADDIGNDCFHLSVRGQMKIAKAVKAEMMAKFSL